MVLAECLEGRPWEVVGSDISMRVLQRARRGHYPEQRAAHIPHAYRRRYCLRGVGEQAGTLLIERSLREKVQFLQINLNAELPPRLGSFDVIFLRNVMIYFAPETRRALLAEVHRLLAPDGVLFLGSTEQPVDPSLWTAVLSGGTCHLRPRTPS